MKIKYLWFSFVWSIYACIYSTLMYYVYKTHFKSVVDKLIELSSSIFGMYGFSFLDVIKIGSILYLYLLGTSFCIFLIYKALNNMYIFFYLFGGPKFKFDNVNITIDEDNCITESYMQFRDGTQIPINIRKMRFQSDELRKESDDEET